MYDPQIEFPEPLVPRELTFGIAERVLADGDIAARADAAQDRRAARPSESKGVARSLSAFSTASPIPTTSARSASSFARALPDVFISLSSEIAPQIREYQRASTATVNAYTMPISLPYLRGLSQRLQREGFANTPLIMLSSGGVVGAETAGRHPARMIESGPAAGALAACHYAEVLGIDRLMSFDMGGTTAKACLIEDGTPLITGLFEVDRR